MAGGMSFVLHVNGDMKKGTVSRVVSCQGGGYWFSPMEHVVGLRVLLFHSQAQSNLDILLDFLTTNNNLRRLA